MTNMSAFAHSIMEHKYAHALGDGLETWENIAYRATKHPMRAIGYTMRDGLSQDICKAITARQFLPAGRYLYASGRPYHQVQNCLLLGVHDSREGWSDLLHKSSMALMTGAGIGVEYCLAPKTRVLKADLTWSPIANISPGDVLIGFDEDLNLQKGQLQKSTVLSVKRLNRPSYLIETDQGTVVASAEHKWVARSAIRVRGDGRRRDSYQWLTTAELAAEHEIAFTTKPWHRDTSWQGGYIAGILDGEGWLSGSRLGVSQNPGIVLDAITNALNESEVSYGTYPNSASSSCTQIIPRGKWESMKLFGIYRPPRLEPKSESLWLGRKVGGKTTKPARILAVTYLGDQEVVGLQTSTGTLIAEGFLCHNSDIRHEGAIIRRTGGKATGPLALMQMLNECGRGIMQGGSRRSAIWAGLRWDHPDIFKFIHIKDWSEAVKDLKKLNFNFPATLDCTNISVGLNDEFFLAYNDVEHPKHSLAQSVYWEVVKQMLVTGEPGFSVNTGKNALEIYRNACTEVSSKDTDDICNLGSINLARVNTIEEFESLVELGTVYLLAGTMYSDVPYVDVDRVRSKNRRLGLGLMGVHEWLLKRGKSYAPDHELWQWLQVYQKSTKIAREWADELDISRPVKTRAIAPTGTISIVAETTSGIEPIFCVAYKRRYLKGSVWHYQYVVDPTAARLIKNGVRPDLIEDAYDLSWDVERRVDFQHWMQQAVDHGISSTINLPHWGSEQNNDNMVRPFGDMLMKYLPELRGITCYPDGARDGQPLVPVSYKEAMEHTGEELTEEAADVCSLTKGVSCGD